MPLVLQRICICCKVQGGLDLVLAISSAGIAFRVMTVEGQPQHNHLFCSIEFDQYEWRWLRNLFDSQNARLAWLLMLVCRLDILIDQSK